MCTEKPQYREVPRTLCARADTSGVLWWHSRVSRIFSADQTLAGPAVTSSVFAAPLSRTQVSSWGRVSVSHKPSHTVPSGQARQQNTDEDTATESLGPLLGTELCPPEFTRWALTPNVKAFADGVSRALLRLNEVMRVGPWSERTLITRGRDPWAGSPLVAAQRGGAVCRSGRGRSPGPPRRHSDRTQPGPPALPVCYLIYFSNGLLCTCCTWKSEIQQGQQLRVYERQQSMQGPHTTDLPWDVQSPNRTGACSSSKHTHTCAHTDTHRNTHAHTHRDTQTQTHMSIVGVGATAFSFYSPTDGRKGGTGNTGAAGGKLSSQWSCS